MKYLRLNINTTSEQISKASSTIVPCSVNELSLSAQIDVARWMGKEVLYESKAFGAE